MPYVVKQARSDIVQAGHDGTESVLVDRVGNFGELNFAITKLCNDFLKRSGKSYANINGVIGVLECSKLEFYRRIAGPYEDQKLEENGDVYDIG